MKAPVFITADDREAGSVQAIMCADAEALSVVEGIGSVTARRIRSAVAEAVEPYGITDFFPV